MFEFFKRHKAEIPEYTYEEFEAISVRIIKKLPHNTVAHIASSVWKTGSKDIRDVLKIAMLCNLRIQKKT